MLHQSITEDYIPNQPIDSQFFLSDRNDFLFPSNLLGSHAIIERHQAHQPQWNPLHHHTEYGVSYNEVEAHSSKDNQVSSILWLKPAYFSS